MAVAPAQARHDGGGEVAEREVDIEKAGELWWLFLISGVVSGAIGIALLVYPGPSLKVVGVFLGIDLLIAGVLLIARGVAKHSAADADDSPAMLLLGTLALIAGLIVIRNPGHTVVLLTLAFAIYLVVAGALALGRALVNREHRGVSVARGVVLVAAGVVIIAWPDISLKTLAVLAGIALLLQAAVEIGEAFLVRSVAKAERAS
jgi:uncharacterized membrane protein HdeD (DUF308 family)